MDKLTNIIFERAYQSYLTGGDTYCIKLSSSNPRTIEQYDKALEFLEEQDLIHVVYKSDKKIRLSLTDEGVKYGSSHI